MTTDRRSTAESLLRRATEPSPSAPVSPPNGEGGATVVREPPQRVGRYRIISPLGAGGMGEVYLAEDEALGRRVAIKVMAPGQSPNSDGAARFLREARAIAQLAHPSIVAIHDYGVDGERQYFTMEYLEGSSLRDVLRRGGAMSRPEALRIAGSIASALAAAHERGIVHRDIKPENVVIHTSGEVKVVDFGIARWLEAAEANRGEIETPTRAGTVIGTIDYMAPEQLRGEPVEGSADVFALGAVLYEMLAGRRPFEGLAVGQTVAAILGADPAPLPGIDAGLSRLIGSMLAKQPSMRPAVADIARELRSLLEPSPAAEASMKPLTTADIPTNLPSDTAPLTGRDAEVDAIIALLLCPETRMVTVTGPAGVGKSRVALAAARRASSHFSDGVWFAPLESVREAALVGSALAGAAGVEPNGLLERLRRDQALLVIDNFEHVMEAAGELVTLLLRTERLKILVTSQAPVQIRAEHEYPLEPLPLPPERGPCRALAENAAVAMFVDRARSARPDFTLTEENATTVAAICRVVGGLPLAIELAAVRIRMLSPSAILEGLRDPLAFLTGGPRDMPARQRELRSALEWSVGLLDAREAEFFADLSVFHGGWTLAACDEVFGASASLLEALVDKGLVRRAGSAGEERFGMLDAIRRLAESRLTDGARQRELADRHLVYFAAFAESAAPLVVGAQQPVGMARFASEVANLRAALSHASTPARGALGLRLALGVWKFWEIRGLYREGREWLSRLLALAGDVGPQSSAAAWYALGVLADAERDYEAAYRSFTEQLAICRTAGDRWATASAINNVAIAALRLGRFDDAAALHAESLAAWRVLGNRAAAALSLQNVGHVERARGNEDAARAAYREAVEIFVSLEDARGVAVSLTCLADLERDSGNFEDAVAHYEDALQRFMALNDHWQVAQCMADYGSACRRAGRAREARSLLVESALIFREVGDLPKAAEVLEDVAALAVERGEPELGLQLGGAAAAVRRELGLRSGPRGDIEVVMERARAAAGEAADAAWQRGWTMGFHEAVDRAQVD